VNKAVLYSEARASFTEEDEQVEHLMVASWTGMRD
jgi:hypothetical protein